MDASQRVRTLQGESAASAGWNDEHVGAPPLTRFISDGEIRSIELLISSNNSSRLRMQDGGSWALLKPSFGSQRVQLYLVSHSP